MRSLRFVAVLFLASMLTLALGCGGGGGGGTSGGGPLATGTFVKQVGTSSDGGNWYPWSNTYDVKVQFLYLASEINGSGKLTAIRLNRAGAIAADITCPNVTVKMGHTDLTALTTTWANNVATGHGSEMTVIDNKIVTIPTGSADTWFDIPLDTAFEYNGVDNLVVDFELTTKCAPNDANMEVDTTAGRRAYASSTDNNAGVAEYNPTTAANVDGNLPWMQFVFSGGDDVAGVTTGTAGTHDYPFTGNSSIGRKAQFLYKAAEIDGSGPITGIGFLMNATSTAVTYSYTVRIGHTTISDFVGNTTFDDNFSGTPVTVAKNASLIMPAGVPSGEYFWLPLPDGAFTYNGTDNLIVEVETTASTGAILIRSYSTPGTAAKMYGDLGAATGTELARTTPMKFRFNGGTMDVKYSPAAGGDGFPFQASAGARQYLFYATDLGTSGTINEIACRNSLAGPSTNQTHTYTIVMSSTSATALVTTRATNLPSPVTVFNGDIDMPAGLIAGDYFTMPLSSGFHYDGTSNLVIDISGTGTASTFECSMGTSPQADRRAYSTNENAVTMTGTNASVPEMRISIKK